MSESPGQERTAEGSAARASLARELVRRWRLTLFVAVLVAELVMFFFAATYPIDPAEQQALMDQANGILGSTEGQSAAGLFSAISVNNLRVALLEMVPVAGVLLFVFSIFTTGQVIQALALSKGLPGPVFGIALFFFPFAIVELAAYAMAVTSGTLLLIGWRKKKLRIEARIFAIEALVVVGTVLLAAAMETVGIVSPLVNFALWLPLALGLAAALVFIRGARS